MKDATTLKGLGDLKTATTTHLRCKPAREGTEYLDLYLASNEQRRLAKLIQSWERQKHRLQGGHAAVGRSLAKLEEKMGLERAAAPRLPTPPREGDRPAPPPGGTHRPWEVMPLEY